MRLHLNRKPQQKPDFTEEDGVIREPADKYRAKRDRKEERDRNTALRHQIAENCEHLHGKFNGGQPSKYKEGMLDQIYKFALLGLTNDEIAAFLGIAGETFQLWCKTRPGVEDALFAGRELADAQVVRAMHQRAIGYSHPAVKIFFDKERGEIVRVPYTERYPPDTAAAGRWLAARQGKRWKETQTIEYGDGQGGTLPPPQFVIAPVQIQQPQQPNFRVIEGDKVEDKFAD
jgi:hypothetical protein